MGLLASLRTLEQGIPCCSPTPPASDKRAALNSHSLSWIHDLPGKKPFLIGSLSEIHCVSQKGSVSYTPCLGCSWFLVAFYVYVSSWFLVIFGNSLWVLVLLVVLGVNLWPLVVFWWFLVVLG